MKKYRRIEITAFRRRVTIVSGESLADNQSAQTETEVWLEETDSPDTIETESAEGQEILIEAVRVLEQKLSERARRTIFK